jgi:hypothetical protein
MKSNNFLFIYIAFGIVLFGFQLVKTIGFSKKRIVELRLIKLLVKAEKMISQYQGGYSQEYLSAQEFHNDLKDAIEVYKNGDNSTLDKFYIWFAPTCQWDDFIGKSGEKIADEIFEIVCKLKNK